MNFLEICQRTNSLAGFQGLISSVTATGYQQTLVEAVKDAYEDIQRYRSEWPWLRGTRQVSVSDVGGTYYSLEDLWAGESPDLAEWLYVNYDFRRTPQINYDHYVLLEYNHTDKPREYAVDPVTKGLYINPLDGPYVLDIYYIKELDELSRNTQVPLLPARHHMLIIYGALMKLSTFIGNPTLYDTYSVKYFEGMAQLMREENPGCRVIKRPVA